jgi:ABC-type Na+ efflux pump permease subunit
MMAIVTMLFGILYCAASSVPSIIENFDEFPSGLLRALPCYILIVGILFIISGAGLAAMFPKADDNPALGTPILILGTLIAVCAILSLVFIYRNPVSWMTGILGLAVFIDSLCLKIYLSKDGK